MRRPRRPGPGRGQGRPKARLPEAIRHNGARYYWA